MIFHTHKTDPERYMRRKSNYCAVDHIRREHWIIEAECADCGEWFQVGRMHAPETVRELELLAENDRFKQLLQVGMNI